MENQTYTFVDSIQRGILYLCKSRKEFAVESIDLIKPEYFESNVHQVIFRIIKDHFTEYSEVPNDDILIEEVKKYKSKKENLSDYKSELRSINAIDEESIKNESYILDRVEEFAKSQAIKEAIMDSIDDINSGNLSKVEDRVRHALTVGRNVDLGTDYFSTVTPRWERAAQEKDTTIYKTPFPTINHSLEGGLAPKELALVVAPPGVGKSLFLANQCQRSAIDGFNVLYISLEMSEDRVAQRLDSIFTKIKQDELSTSVGTIAERISSIREKFSNIGEIRIKEFPCRRLTANGLRAYLSQLKNYDGFTPDVIIVDYLELMTTDDKNLSEYQSQQRIAEELRGIAQEEKALIWTATQTNREGRKVDIITDSELADSYGKIRVCDLAFSINQKEEDFDKGIARLYVMKSRNGRARFLTEVNIDYTTLTVSQKK